MLVATAKKYGASTIYWDNGVNTQLFNTPFSDSGDGDATLEAAAVRNLDPGRREQGHRIGRHDARSPVVVRIHRDAVEDALGLGAEHGRDATELLPVRPDDEGVRLDVVPGHRVVRPGEVELRGLRLARVAGVIGRAARRQRIDVRIQPALHSRVVDGSRLPVEVVHVARLPHERCHVAAPRALEHEWRREAEIAIEPAERPVRHQVRDEGV